MVRPSVVALLLAVVCPMSSAAQDRMPPIPADQMTDEQRAAVEEFRAARGAGISGPFVPLLRSPQVMNRARAMGDYLRFKSVLPPRLSEFAILITARHWTQNYEWDAHYALAIKGGLREAVAQALAEGRRPLQMADDEEVLYDFCTELQRNQSVSDSTYARAVAAFGEQGVIDLVGISGYYTFLAMVLNTARTPLAPGRTPALPSFPR
jgi:4-carboxymuconolactone decarboxylase